MTNLRTAAQQALEAMLNFPDDISDDMFESITALKAALAEPVREPIGYWQGKYSHDGGAVLYEVPQVSAFGYTYRNIPLYTAPPQRKPLREEEISRLFRTAGSPLAFARAVERAHGIGATHE